MLPYTRQVHFLEDDEMALVSAKGVMMFNARTGARIKPQKQTLTWSVSEVEKGAYPFFMLKEIHEQPGVMADIAADNAEHAVKLAGIIKQSYGTYMVGCGTAAYACLAGSYLFSKIARRHVNWAIGSEFGYQLDFLTDKSLILALSQSGETMDLLDSVKKAKEKKAKIAALVNVLGSSLWRLADYTLVIGAGPEKGVASTKAFIGKLAHLTLLAYALDGRIREGQKVVTMAVKSAKAVLAEPTVSRIQKLAKKYKRRGMCM